MNKLLKEFLSYVLVESQVSDQAKSMGLQSMGFGRWGKDGKVTHKTINGKLQPVKPSEEPPRAGGEKPVAKPSVDKKQPDVVQTKGPERVGGVFQRIKQATSNLGALAKQFTQKIYSGSGQSIGTVGSTQGEHSSCASAQDFISGRGLAVDGRNVPVPAGISDANIEKAKEIIRSRRGGKSFSEYEATNRAIELAWMERERLRYTKAGSEPPDESWLKYAYRSGLSAIGELRDNPDYGADMPATTSAVQSGEIPPPMVMNAENRASTMSYLKDMVDNSSTPEEQAHYQTLLLAMDVAEDTDTVVHFINKDGRSDILLVSNKKSKNDPHGNTTPQARIKTLKQRLGEDPEVAQEIIGALEEAQAIISRGGDSVAKSRTHFASMSDADKQSAAEILQTRFKSLPAGRGTADYTDKILNARPVKNAVQKLYCADNPSNCRDGRALKEIPKSYQRSNVGRAFITAVEDSGESSPAILTKILGKVGDSSEESDRRLLGPVIDAGKETRQAAKDAHDLIVSRLTDADDRICKQSPDRCQEGGNTVNGPATQAYIGSFMQDTHWDQYICNSDDCTDQDAISARKMVDIDGHKVTPKKFRECLASISGFSGDTQSHEGQRGLWSHLQRNLIVRAGEDSISVRDGSGARKIGRETYRTKGDQSSLLTFLGKDMTDCVTTR